MRALVLPDEDELVVPEVWRAALHPRRGGLTGPERPVPADPVGRYREWLGSERTRENLAELESRWDVLLDPVLLAEGRRHRDSWLDASGDDATPRGSAVAVLLTLDKDRHTDPDADYAVDAWIARHGVEFAARAVGELAGLVSENGVSGFWTPDPAATRDRSGLRRTRDLVALFDTAHAVRTRLTTVTDEEFDRAVEALGGYRTSPSKRILASYLAPTRVDWVDADCAEAANWEADRYLCTLLLLAASSVRHLELLRDNVSSWLFGGGRTEHLSTVLDGVGPAATPLLVEPFYLDLFKLGDPHFYRRERMGPEGFRLLAATPTDDAFRLLCRAALSVERTRPGTLLKSGVLARFPIRALRVLAELESVPPLTYRHQYRNTVEMFNQDEQLIYTDLLGRQVLADPRLVTAAADLLPADVRDRVQEIVATGGAGLGAGLAALLDRHHRARYQDALDSADEEKRTVGALASIPADDAFGHLVDRVDRPYFRPALLTAARRDPARAMRVLLAKAGDSDTVATLLHNHVLAHPDAIPEDLDEPARARVAAILAETPDTAGSTPAVLAGPPAGKNGRPTRVPEPPEWLVLPALPPVALRTGDQLSQDAVRNLYALLAVSKIAAAHPGVAEVRALCEPRDLSAFAWAVFGQWRAADYPPKSTLGMVAVALLGDDRTVADLVEEFPSWAKGANGRVRTGMDALVAIGSEAALRQLYRLSRKAKTTGFRTQAELRLIRAAEARGLTTAQLADRVVPDLGLDADAGTTLDYGPRRFTVRFDALFAPHLADQHGKALTRMPRPVATDDEEQASTAYRRYAALKKDAQAVAVERTGALEMAMVDGRRWSAPDFRRLFVEHPLVWQLAHRLLWAVFDERGEVVTAFRPAEDRTFADIDDKTLELAEDATVGIAHPWHVGADREAWTAVFDDYEIIQPFAQLGRELFTLPEAEAGLASLDRLVGRAVASRRLWVLASRGWQFDSGHSTLSREWPDDRTVSLGFLGYSFQDPDHEEKLTRVEVHSTRRKPGPVAFADLDPIALSEVLRDVDYLAL